MFDLNTLKPESPDNNSKILKKFRYLLFSLREVEDRAKNGIEYNFENPDFTTEEIADIKAQIEEMEHFDTWINYGITFDVVWAGLYIETDNKGTPIEVFWRPGFHGSDRQMIFPIRLTHVNKVKRMETTFNDTRKIMDLVVPNGLRNAVLKNKEKQQLYLEKQMVAQMLPGGDAFAKESIKADKIQKTIDEQKELNEKLKNIAKEERETNNKE